MAMQPTSPTLMMEARRRRRPLAADRLGHVHGGRIVVLPGIADEPMLDPRPLARFVFRAALGFLRKTSETRSMAMRIFSLRLMRLFPRLDFR